MPCLKVKISCFSQLENFFKLVLDFLLKCQGAERKKPLKHILFFPLDLSSLQSDDSEQQTNGKAARLPWLPFYCHKFDPPWNIIFKDWKDSKLNSALSYHGTTLTLLSLFTLMKTYFMPEGNLVYWVYSQCYRKNKMCTAGSVCCSCFAVVGAGSKVNDCNHTMKSVVFWTMHVFS